MYKRFTNSIVVAAPALAVAIGLIAMGTPSAGLAEPPAKRDCTGVELEDVFDRLTCRQAALAEQMEYTSDEAFKDGTRMHGTLRKAQIEQLQDAKQKAGRARDKNDRGFFKRQAKSEVRGNKQGGHLVPFDDFLDDIDGDGICDFEQGNENAQCAAVELGPGGELQVCNPEKKNKGKGKGQGNPKFEGLECDRAVDPDEAASPAEAEDMDEAAEQLEATYEVAEENMIEMNQQLDIVNATGPAPTFAAANGCDVPATDPNLIIAAQVLRNVKSVTFGIARVNADVMGQVAFGFNARGAAAVFDTIAAVADIAYLNVEFERQRDSAASQAAILNCVTQSAGEIAALQGQVASLQAQIVTLQLQMQQDHDEIMANDNTNTATIMTKVEMVREEVVELLNTPQGQREQFPAK